MFGFQGSGTLHILCQAFAMDPCGYMTGSEKDLGPLERCHVGLLSYNWAAFKELKLSYHNPETKLFTIYTYIHNMVIYTKFLSSKPDKASCCK